MRAARAPLTALAASAVLAGCAVLAGLLAVGGAADAGIRPVAPRGTVQACTDYAVSAIQRHVTVTGRPAECQGLTGAQVNQAVETAIREESRGDTKSASRKQAGEAARWVASLLSGPVPTTVPALTVPAASGRGSRLGGVSDMTVSVAALVAWLAVAASGGYLLASWLISTGNLRLFAGNPRGLRFLGGNLPLSGRDLPRRRRGAAAPPGVIAAHASGAIAGLALWISYLITGWPALAWTATVLLLPVAGLGMGLVILGLPGGRAVRRRSRRTLRTPVLTIAGHGLAAAITLLLVFLAAVGS
ncbi:MAG: hypothetical protein JOY82_00050 [Streptosporangiaceae bacterium]|nr:hypothetical protein [Streptosporangiaceae bacterium]MBV9852906.1 hypothetical protein [Streptosporangiaceae bacterium]